MRLMKIQSSVVVLALLSLASACSHGLTVESEPEGAEVLINGKPVGATPLTLEASALPPRGNLRLTAEKKGHGVANTYLPNPVEIGASQRVLILIPKSEAEISKINRHTSLIMRAHRLYLQKRSFEARNLIEEALLENPNYLYPHLLSGAIHFMNQEFDQAQVSYKRALDIDPDNSDAKQMLKIIANRQSMPAGTMPLAGNPPAGNGRTPASSPDGKK